MSLPAEGPGRRKNRIHRRRLPIGFSMVEMIVALGVACILMVAIVAFLVNGVVSTSKTSAINDTTTRGRHVFEHLSNEVARSGDLALANFTTPGGSGYAGFNYRIDVGGAGLAQQTQLTSRIISVTFPNPPSPPDYLVPQTGDYLVLPYPQFTAGSAQVVVLLTTPASPGTTYQFQLPDTLASLSGQPTTAQVTNNETATIQRQRSYAIQVDSTTGDTELWWYPATGNMPTTMVIAKSLVAGQHPFIPQLKPSTTGTAYYVGLNLALAVTSEAPNVLAGKKSFYSNNTVSAVFANRAGPSFSMTYSPTPVPTPSPTPSPSPTPTPSPTPPQDD